MKIRKNDTVLVIAWKDKGTTAKVIKAMPKSNKLVVEGVNIATKHVKKQGTNPGQIVKIEKSIDVSNVMIICPITNKPTKIGYVIVDDKWVSKKFRYSKVAVKDNKKEPKDSLIK